MKPKNSAFFFVTLKRLRTFVGSLHQNQTNIFDNFYLLCNATMPTTALCFGFKAIEVFFFKLKIPHLANVSNANIDFYIKVCNVCSVHPLMNYWFRLILLMIEMENGKMKPQTMHKTMDISSLRLKPWNQNGFSCNKSRITCWCIQHVFTNR